MVHSIPYRAEVNEADVSPRLGAVKKQQSQHVEEYEETPI